MADARFIVEPEPHGSSLREILSQAPLDPRRAAWLVRCLARALMPAHAAGLVHGGLVPEDLRIVDGSATVAAACVDRGEPTLLAAGRLPIAASYLSPERILGAPLTPATDVYGLGLVLHEALAGRPAFWGRSDQATLDQQRFRPVRLPDAGLERTSGAGGRGSTVELAPVVLRCLEKRPSKRFQTLEELVGALDNCLSRRRRSTSGRRRVPTGGGAVRSETSGPAPSGRQAVRDQGAPIRGQGAPIRDQGAPIRDRGAPRGPTAVQDVLGATRAWWQQVLERRTPQKPTDE